jgi:hypothetical protein
MSLLNTYTVTVSVSGLEIMALKKLSLVSHALAQKMGGQHEQEQKALATTLDDLIRQIEIKAASTR